MKIIVAQTAGFCMGVERAVRLALKHSDNGQKKISTPGPLIHNNQAIEMLEENNITSLSHDDAPRNQDILIRAHGIPPAKEKEFRRNGCSVIDGTCPMVKKVHRVIEKYINLDRDIIITGDENHAETKGLMGYAGDRGWLINCPEKVQALPATQKALAIVSQTTFSISHFQAIVDAVRKRFPDRTIAVENTICKATKERQNEVITLRKKADMMIVVGGKHSANTLRLAEIAGESGTPVLHIENSKELDVSRLSNVSVLGITAGASTPGWVIKEVVEKIESTYNNGGSHE
ncbi:MAG: 4-hydroxy-3-methylbut-2-enyl diphosphate reductase [Fibrobacterota bacterium]